MKKLFIGLFIHISICSLNALHADDANLKLWYNSPADATVADNPNGWKDDAEWLKAMPLGNGSLGAVVFGDVGYERIQLNEETMWSGSPQECDNPEAAKHLDEIKDLLKNGKYREATALRYVQEKVQEAATAVPFHSVASRHWVTCGSTLRIKEIILITRVSSTSLLRQPE